MWRAAGAVAAGVLVAFLAPPGAAARPEGGAGSFGAPLRVFLEVEPALWDPAVCQTEAMFVFRFRENDEELSRLHFREVPLSCDDEIPRGQNGLSLTLTPEPALPFPRGWDRQDDVWFHVMLFDRQSWLDQGVLTPRDLFLLEDGSAAENSSGPLDYELLARLRPLGAATALCPVTAPPEGPCVLELVDLPAEDGDAFASSSPYAAFSDCEPADPSISPFERERLDDLPGVRDNDCDGIVGAAYQRLLVSTSGQIDLPAEVPPRAVRAGHLFRARPEDVVALLRGDNGRLRLSHLALNLSNVAAGLRDENVDALVAVDRDLDFAPFDGDSRLRAGDLVLSFASTVPKGDFGPAGAALPGAVEPTDLVLFRRASQEFELLLDGGDVGLNENSPEDVDAAELVLEPIAVGGVALEPGDLLLSTRGRLKAPALAGGTLRRQDEDVVLFRPSRLGADTVGGFAPFLDGDGRWKKNADALALVELARDLPGLAQAGDLLLSTATAYTTQGVRVQAQDVAVWRPDGAGGAQYVARLEGAQAGLAQPGEDIDGIDLDRFAAVYGQACQDPAIGDGVFQCGTAVTGWAGLITPEESRNDPWLGPLPFAAQGSWGWDRLRPGSYTVDFEPTLLAACFEQPPGKTSALVTFTWPDLDVTVGVNDRVALQISYSFSGVISGVLFRDADGDGAFDASEGLAEIPVWLYRDDGDGVAELGGADVLVDQGESASGGKAGFYRLDVPAGGPCRGSYWLDYAAKASLVPAQDDPLLVDHTGNPLALNLRFE